MNVCALMSLTEAVAGFNGGSIVDEFPQMTLEECAGRLPVVIMESSIELCDMVQTHNDALVEAAVGQIQTGSDTGINSLVEGAFSNIKAKIKAFFEKIKKFVKSIIDKLGVHINKVRMTGKQMLAKYGDSKMLNKDFSSLTFTGYKFEKKDPFTNLDSYCDKPRSMVATAVPVGCKDPADFADAYGKADVSDEELANAEQELAKVKETSSDDRKLNVAKALLKDIDLSSGSSWQSDVMEALWGDKVDLKYGADFDIDSIKSDLQGEQLSRIQATYRTLLKGLENDQKVMEAASNKFSSKEGNAGSPGNPPAKGIGLANSYYTTYLSIYQDITGVITAVGGIRTSWVNDRVKQAKNIFARMLTYTKKDESADPEGLDEFDVFM